jgi:hypothetical protein
MFAAAASVSTETRDLFTSKLAKYLQANKVNAGFPELSAIFISLAGLFNFVIIANADFFS